MTTCRGRDVSAYQGAQDWAAHRASGETFAFAKASEGERSHDARFVQHIAGIKAAGLVPGAYHYGWPAQDAALEAANYIAAVKPYAGPGFVHWLDLEKRTDGANYGGRTNAQILTWATKWLALVAEAFPGQRVGAYTSGTDLSRDHIPVGTPLWYPAYPGTSVDTYAEAEAHIRPEPYGWKPLFWQFTSRDPDGTSVDRSVCYLSETGLRTWAGEKTTENDMNLTDAVSLGAWIPKQWPKDTGLADGKLSVNNALGSGYAHARIAAEGTTALLAQVAALSAALGKLAEGGGVDAAAIQAAALAGAQEALSRLGDALKEA